MKIPAKVPAKIPAKIPAKKPQALTGKLIKKAAKVATPEAKKLAKESHARHMVGFGFQSPAVVFAISHGIQNLRVVLVNSTTPDEEVAERVKECHKKRTLFVVCGAAALRKLGPKKSALIGNMLVSLHDVCEVLAAIPNVRIVDANIGSNGAWFPMPKQQKIEDLQSLICGSGYRPVHPDKIAKVLATFHVAIPDYSKSFDALSAFSSLLQSINNEYRTKLQSALYQFLAGISNRRSYAAMKRASSMRLLPQYDKTEFNRLWASIQQWIENPEQGRKVTAAYQLLAKRKVTSAAIAAGRVDADLGVLNSLLVNIPPTPKLQFSVIANP